MTLKLIHQVSESQLIFARAVARGEPLTEAYALTGLPGKNPVQAAHMIMRKPAVLKIIAMERQKLAEMASGSRVTALKGLEACVAEAETVAERVSALKALAAISGPAPRFATTEMPAEATPSQRAGLVLERAHAGLIDLAEADALMSLEHKALKIRELEATVAEVRDLQYRVGQLWEVLQLADGAPKAAIPGILD